MIENCIEIDAGLAQRLEDYFCEDYQEHWFIREDWLTHQYFLNGYFETGEELSAAVDQLRNAFPELPHDGTIAPLQDFDWKEAYKLHFKPWSERGLHWVPVWERDNYNLPDGEQIVYLDPGMAFGTGNHETTRLCVRRLLDARDQWGSTVSAKRVIDAGCGSGILAISAGKLGFNDILAFDKDPESVRISQHNEILCEIEGTIEFKWADLNDGLAGTSADLLLANILANILCDHARILCESIRPGGMLVLSGLLAREIDEVHAVFAREIENLCGKHPPRDARIDGEWADLCYALPESQSEE